MNIELLRVYFRVGLSLITGYGLPCMWRVKCASPAFPRISHQGPLREGILRSCPSSAVAANWWSFCLSNACVKLAVLQCHQLFLIYLRRWNNQSANSSVPMLFLLQYFIRDASLSRIILQLFCSLKIQVKIRNFTVQCSFVSLVRNHTLR